jgi:hypothetical protein
MCQQAGESTGRILSPKRPFPQGLAVMQRGMRAEAWHGILQGKAGLGKARTLNLGNTK